MAKGDHPHRKRAKGATGGGYARPRVQIGFDPDMLREITALAKTHNRSFAAEVRELVSMGIKASKPKPWRENARAAIGG